MVAALGQHQCDGTHRHVTLENRRAKAWEKYPDKVFEVVLRAMRDDFGANINLVKASTDSAGDDPWPWKRLIASAECDDVRGVIGVHADEAASETSRATLRIDVTIAIEDMMNALNAAEEDTQHLDYLYDDYEFVDDVS